MIVDGVSIDDLTRIMKQDIPINEADYRDWWERKVWERKGLRDWIQGSDFYHYWQCPRMLHFETHDPLPSQPSEYLYRSIICHTIVEDFLTKHGWECEVRVKNWFNVKGRWIKGVGRIDGLSPSKIVLDIKTGKPRQGHLLQTGYYQLHIQQSPAVILLYRDKIVPRRNLRPLAERILPEVAGCVLSPFTPPPDPSPPHCYGYCIYKERCRNKRSKTQQTNQNRTSCSAESTVF